MKVIFEDQKNVIPFEQLDHESMYIFVIADDENMIYTVNTKGVLISTLDGSEHRPLEKNYAMFQEYKIVAYNAKHIKYAKKFIKNGFEPVPEDTYYMDVSYTDISEDCIMYDDIDHFIHFVVGVYKGEPFYVQSTGSHIMVSCYYEGLPFPESVNKFTKSTAKECSALGAFTSPNDARDFIMNGFVHK